MVDSCSLSLPQSTFVGDKTCLRRLPSYTYLIYYGCFAGKHDIDISVMKSASRLDISFLWWILLKDIPLILNSHDTYDTYCDDAFCNSVCSIILTLINLNNMWKFQRIVKCMPQYDMNATKSKVYAIFTLKRESYYVSYAKYMYIGIQRVYLYNKRLNNVCLK